MTSVLNPADPSAGATAAYPVPGSGQGDHSGHAADHSGHAVYHPGAYPVYRPAPPGRFASFLLRLGQRAPRWLAPAAILTCFGGAVGYVLVSDPTDAGADALPTCLVKLTTGFDCPGCGGTRAFYYLVQGNLPAAARHHLLFVFAVPFLIYLYVAWAAKEVFGRSLPALRLPPATVAVFLAAWGVFTVVRNLPWAPFTWLYV